jgi:Tfp pilus assembly protein PilF
MTATAWLGAARADDGVTGADASRDAGAAAPRADGRQLSAPQQSSKSAPRVKIVRAPLGGLTRAGFQSPTPDESLQPQPPAGESARPGEPPNPRTMIRGRALNWRYGNYCGNSYWRYSADNIYYGYDPLTLDYSLDEAYWAGRYDERADTRHQFNVEDMEYRRQRVLSNHEKALRLGVERLKRGEYAQAVIALTLAGRLDNGDPACRIHLAQARLAQGHYAEAGKALRRGLQLQPNLVFTDLHLERYYPDDISIDAFRDRLAEHIRAGRGSVESMFLLGYLEFQRGQFEAASAAFSAVARAWPDDPVTESFLEITCPPGD